MTATALSFKGYLAERTGHPGAMVGLTEAAMRDRGVFVGQRAYDALPAARGHAMLGQRGEVADAAAEAGDLTAEFVEYDGPAPPWHYYRSPGFFSMEQGLVYQLLGEHDAAANTRAIELLSGGLEALPAEQRDAEWAVMYRLELARALARAGDEVGAMAAVEAVRVVAAAAGAVDLGRQMVDVAARLSADA
jgi:hypothetical protein